MKLQSKPEIEEPWISATFAIRCSKATRALAVVLMWTTAKNPEVANSISGTVISKNLVCSDALDQIRLVKSTRAVILLLRTFDLGATLMKTVTLLSKNVTFRADRLS